MLWTNTWRTASKQSENSSKFISGRGIRFARWALLNVLLLQINFIFNFSGIKCCARNRNWQENLGAGAFREFNCQSKAHLNNFYFLDNRNRDQTGQWRVRHCSQRSLHEAEWRKSQCRNQGSHAEQMHKRADQGIHERGQDNAKIRPPERNPILR